MMTLEREQEQCASRPVEGSALKDGSGKPARPVRSRRYTRRGYVTGQRPQKRLFTPEIKRYLKDWLVRRRENPYPNRDEKKYLAKETGLTYIQICNWFANWRRKLKNVNNMEMNQQTWGHLIRTYNDRAQGNVEQFSISSDDSIWSEPALGEPRLPDPHRDCDSSDTSKESYEHFNNNSDAIETKNDPTPTSSVSSPLLLSKWLESAARFQPSESNYSWWGDGKGRSVRPAAPAPRSSWARHGRDEVEAAVALTALAAAAAASSSITAP